MFHGALPGGERVFTITSSIRDTNGPTLLLCSVPKLWSSGPALRTRAREPSSGPDAGQGEVQWFSLHVFGQGHKEVVALRLCSVQ